MGTAGGDVGYQIPASLDSAGSSSARLHESSRAIDRYQFYFRLKSAPGPDSPKAIRVRPKVEYLGIALAGWLLPEYVDERDSWCGSGRHSIQALAQFGSVVFSAATVGGYHLTKCAGFGSRWWRFFRNITLMLVLVMLFGVHA